ncbi:hypothetical protein VTK73DRAFT_5462 [Phialemonium thermophilum]|uniref:NmrA-like domain-containing protein n=1 Tax=Phialemonium thermophilum TaxID=223376 RepID=A0ABR3WNX9_9PEZI
MSLPIKNVAVIGASGNLGGPVVDELLAAGFAVTALSRASSTATFPPNVAVKKVDFSSTSDLTSALQGQDAVVSLIATAAVGAQRPIVDAAVAAGVRRYIPSEFGINTREAAQHPVGKILAGKIGTVDYLIEKAKENPGFTWTGISTGLFFDWGLRFGSLGIDVPNKTATIVDSGNEKWQASNLHHIGKAIAAVLRNPDAVANEYIGTASFDVSQNEVLQAVEEVTGTKLSVTRVSSEDLRKLGEEKLAAGDFSAFLQLVRVWNFADGAGHALGANSANAKLGLPNDDLKATIKAVYS